MPQVDPQAPAQGSLVLGSVLPAGRSLGLQPGDQLIAINGKPFDGQSATLLKRFGTGNTLTELALTFRRDGKEWAVLSKTAKLGHWRKHESAGNTDDERFADPQRLRNWEVYSLNGGAYDTQPTKPTWMALIPPLHLVQMRLWSPLAIWVALSGLCIPLGWIGGTALQILMSVYFWQASPVLFRRDRMMQGYRSWRMIAARSESQLHKTMSELAPNMPFVLSRAPAPSVEQQPN